jgi:hypothetical protein
MTGVETSNLTSNLYFEGKNEGNKNFCSIWKQLLLSLWKISTEVFFQHNVNTISMYMDRVELKTSKCQICRKWFCRVKSKEITWFPLECASEVHCHCLLHWNCLYMRIMTVFFCSVLLNWDEWRGEDIQGSNIRRRVETSCDCCDSQHLHVPVNTGFTERYGSYFVYNF